MQGLRSRRLRWALLAIVAGVATLSIASTGVVAASAASADVWTASTAAVGVATTGDGHIGIGLRSAAGIGDPPCFFCEDQDIQEPFCQIAVTLGENVHEDTWEYPATHYENNPEEWHVGCFIDGNHANNWCGELHANECEAPAQEALSAIVRAVSRGNYREAVAILDTTKAASLNVERSALQGWDCKGKWVIAHVPIGKGVLQRLRATPTKIQ